MDKWGCVESSEILCGWLTTGSVAKERSSVTSDLLRLRPSDTFSIAIHFNVGSKMSVTFTLCLNWLCFLWLVHLVILCPSCATAGEKDSETFLRWLRANLVSCTWRTRSLGVLIDHTQCSFASLAISTKKMVFHYSELILTNVTSILLNHLPVSSLRTDYYCSKKISLCYSRDLLTDTNSIVWINIALA